jgi:hypothetical protein
VYLLLARGCGRITVVMTAWEDHNAGFIRKKTWMILHMYTPHASQCGFFLVTQEKQRFVICFINHAGQCIFFDTTITGNLDYFRKSSCKVPSTDKRICRINRRQVGGSPAKQSLRLWSPRLLRNESSNSIHFSSPSSIINVLGHKTPTALADHVYQSDRYRSDTA